MHISTRNVYILNQCSHSQAGPKNVSLQWHSPLKISQEPPLLQLPSDPGHVVSTNLKLLTNGKILCIHIIDGLHWHWFPKCPDIHKQFPLLQTPLKLQFPSPGHFLGYNLGSSDF